MSDTEDLNKKAPIDIEGVNQTFVVGEEIIDVLKDINLKINRNTFNIIYGQSGSGKSTLLNVLTGLQKPSSGKVYVNSRNLYELTPDELAHFRAHEIGIVYQQNFWVRSLNVVENVAVPLYFSGFSLTDAKKLAYESLNTVGMTGFANKYPYLLSGGEQQRVAVARALVNNPIFVIADEPTGSLDSSNGDLIMTILRRCQTEQGRTIILVSHNMEYIPLADHLMRIEDGRMIFAADNAAEIITASNSLILGIKNRINRFLKVKKDV
jgi:ABC-type lipoprotein export system ATPase subunit